MHPSLSHCDKNLIMEALFALILDRSKEVKVAALDFCREAVVILDEDLIEAKIRDQRPFIQDSLRQAVTRLTTKRPPAIKLERQANGIKQIRTNKDNNGTRQLDIEFNYSNESDLTQGPKFKKPIQLPPVTSNYNLSGNNTDLEVALKLIGEKDGINSTGFMMSSVAEFGEPTDTEIANMHSALSYILNENFSRGLFSFETAVIRHAIENLKKINIFNKKNMLKLFQYIFIRVFDTHRKGILEPIEILLEFMVQQARAMQMVFAEERETIVVFHTLVRFFISANGISSDLLVKYLPLLNLNILTKLLYMLMNNPVCFENEALLVTLTEFIVVEYANGGLEVTKEFLLYIKSIEFSYQKQIARIFKSVYRQASDQGFTKDQEIAMLFESDEHTGIFRTDDFRDIEHLLARFESGLFGTQDVLANAEEIVNCLISHGNEIIIFEKFKDTNFKMSQMESFLGLLQKLCQIKGLLDQLSPNSCKKMIEQLVLYLIKMDQDKDPAPDRINSKILLIDEVIKITNMSILKLLECNSPNVLYESLFGVLDTYSHKNASEVNDGLAKTSKSKLNGILVKCIIKLTKALKQVIDRLDIPRLLALLNEYVIKYSNEKEDLGIKCIKTIVHELVSLKGDTVLDSLNKFSLEEPPAIMLLINKYVSKNKVIGGAKEDFHREARHGESGRRTVLNQEGPSNSNSKSKGKVLKKNHVTSIEIEDNNFERP